MYLTFFGLTEKPFSITPDPRYLYLSERHAEALAHLLYGINESGGFIQLTGEVGTGKTTIVRTLLSRVPHHADVAVILNPRITPVEFLLTICEELGIAIGEADRNSVKQMVDALNRRLLAAHAEGRRIVVLVDEAQNLSIDVLEQVRLLTNLETATQKLLQIILIGQPELRDLLDRTDLRQLAQRITGRYHLKPLSREETMGYVRHRLKVAGAAEEIFTQGALREVHRLSSGIPRVINVACDRALLGAYTQDRHEVTAALVRKAAGEVYGRRFLPAWLGWLAATLSAAALIALSVGGWQYWQRQDGHLDALRRAPQVAKAAQPARAAPSGAVAPLDPAARDAPDTRVGSSAPASGSLSVSGASPVTASSGPGYSLVPGSSQTAVSAQSPGSSAVPGSSTVPGSSPSAASPANSVPGAPATAGSAAAASAPAAAHDFNELLAASSANTTDAAAFRRLLSLWGTAMAQDKDPCGQAAKAGLACLEQRGSWAQVRSLNRPAILTLTDEHGRRHRVVLSGLDDRFATVALSDHEQKVPLEDLSRDWFGEFTVVWKPKTSRTRLLTVGMHGEEVRWLRRSLNALGGGASDPQHADVFDEELAIAVQNFQREHRLNVDGIAGLQTQVVLDTALAEPGSPLLSAGAARADRS